MSFEPEWPPDRQPPLIDRQHWRRDVATITAGLAVAGLAFGLMDKDFPVYKPPKESAIRPIITPPRPPKLACQAIDAADWRHISPYVADNPDGLAVFLGVAPDQISNAKIGMANCHDGITGDEANNDATLATVQGIGSICIVISTEANHPKPNMIYQDVIALCAAPALLDQA